MCTQIFAKHWLFFVKNSVQSQKTEVFPKLLSVEWERVHDVREVTADYNWCFSFVMWNSNTDGIELDLRIDFFNNQKILWSASILFMKLYKLIY